MSDPFDAVLVSLTDSQRSDVVAAWAAVETQQDPVEQASLRALSDVTLRTKLDELLALSGRILVRATQSTWTSGYRDDIAAQLAREGGDWLTRMDRAVLTVVLIYSVAIPRAQGVLARDEWVSDHPTTPVDLRELNQLGKQAVDESLARLRSAGLVRPVTTPKEFGVSGQSYVPGPQFHRLTSEASARLQDELILAAGPESALAEAINLRRGHGPDNTGEE